MRPFPAQADATDDVRAAQATADWRRTTFELYRRVREAPDPETGHRIWREGRDELFASHPASPLLPGDAAAFDGLPVAGYDPGWRFLARVEPTAPARLEIPTGTDGVVPFERIGTARLPFGSLDVWRHAGYGGGLFVPVRDGEAGRGTFGGGRYLVDTLKGADLGGDDGTIVLDFNFAYNPSCAYDPAWECPLAPFGNTVGTAIPVGEGSWPLPA